MHRQAMLQAAMLMQRLPPPPAPMLKEPLLTQGQHIHRVEACRNDSEADRWHLSDQLSN